MPKRPPRRPSRKSSPRSPRLPSLPKLPELDLSRLTTYSLFARRSKVGTADLGSPWAAGGSFSRFLATLPGLLAARDLAEVAEAVVRARRRGKGVLLGMGAHPLKVGLGPLLADALESGILTGIASNGAAIVHDFELAVAGKTSEEVDASLGGGAFGMAEETAVALNSAIAEGDGRGWGIGYAVGRLLAERGARRARGSIFAAAYRAGVPATVHVALGTDIIHMHPSCDGASLGEASLRDFRLFARQVAALADGVYINLGSAVIMPEVFLKACSLALNLGRPLTGLTTVNLDFIQHYRPRVNVVLRPTAGSGRGYALTGHHEIMLPLLLAAVKERMA